MKNKGTDKLLYKLELDRGGSSTNEIEDEDGYNTINQVKVKCNVEKVLDDKNVSIRGR